MKTIIIFGLLIIGISIFSCNKENNNIEFPYEAMILGVNSDCGLYQIKITKGLDKVKSIVGSTVGDSIYIAKNLPDNLTTNGILIELNLRKPKDNEFGDCTHMGPSYTWIFVTNAMEK